MHLRRQDALSQYLGRGPCLINIPSCCGEIVVTYKLPRPPHQKNSQGLCGEIPPQKVSNDV